MPKSLQFGWRIPDFPEDGQSNAHDRARNFRDQIFNFMDTIHGHFDSAWAGDHFFPWPIDAVSDTMKRDRKWFTRRAAALVEKSRE